MKRTATFPNPDWEIQRLRTIVQRLRTEYGDEVAVYILSIVLMEEINCGLELLTA